MSRCLESRRFTLLYILGSGHCGSTLLDMLLNAHSRIIGLGELVALRRYLRLLETDITGNHTLPPQPGDWQEVSFNPLTTPFWQEIWRLYENVTGNSFASLADACKYPNFRTIILKWREDDIKKRMHPWAQLLFCIHQVTGSEVLTDSSKFPHRLYMLKRSNFFQIKVIHLQRDGRGVVNSYLKKYGRFHLAMQRWMYPSLQSFYVRRLFTDKDWMNVRYEDLATKPEATLAKICRFLGLDYEHNMLSFQNCPILGHRWQSYERGASR